MNNSEYWRERFSLLEIAAHQKSDEYIKSLEKIYRDAENSVKKDIDAWYGRFAINNKISLIDAKKILTAGQLDEFKWSVEKYIEIGKQANISDEWKKKLENASARFHISRLEAIQMQIQQQIEILYGNRVDEFDQLLRDMVLNGYTQGAFEIQKGLGIGWDLTALNQNKLDLMLSKPWTTDNRTFSDRIWTNKANLINDIQKQLIQGLLRGDTPQKTITAIKGKFNTDRYKISRLVHTETSYFNAVCKNQMYHDLDVELIEIVETLDSRTCSICKPLDGKVVSLSQYEPGVTVPPFHPNCRGTTCPYYDDMEGERVARTIEGEVYYIPANMTYEEWYNKFVENSRKNVIMKAVKNNGIKGKIIDKPKKINLSDYQFDEKHINAERNHNITREDAEKFVSNASVVLERWNGRFLCYIGSSGSTYIDVNNKTIRTAFNREEYDEKMLKFIKTVEDYEN